LLLGLIVGTVYNMTYTLQVEQNEITGEYYFILPEKLLKKMNWKEGDDIEWINNKDGSVTLKKV
jgi:bifunctional DNA-binding transcriptional regulator/antitoxin component of YhaV-PrlF toxin-antitoxin module